MQAMGESCLEIGSQDIQVFTQKTQGTEGGFLSQDTTQN